MVATALLRRLGTFFLGPHVSSSDLFLFTGCSSSVFWAPILYVFRKPGFSRPALSWEGSATPGAALEVDHTSLSAEVGSLWPLISCTFSLRMSSLVPETQHPKLSSPSPSPSLLLLSFCLLVTPPGQLEPSLFLSFQIQSLILNDSASDIAPKSAISLHTQLPYLSIPVTGGIFLKCLFCHDCICLKCFSTSDVSEYSLDPLPKFPSPSMPLCFSTPLTRQTFPSDTPLSPYLALQGCFRCHPFCH